MNPEEQGPPPTEDQPSQGTAHEEQDVATLSQRLEQERARAESHYASWQRTAADFANFKRRTEQERSDAIKFANAMLMLNILPILDDLERALSSVSADLAGLTWIDGIHLIYRKLQAMLESQGLKVIEAVGQPFDPNRHEAVLRGPGQEGIVLAELQRGYALNDRVIRPTLVKVGTGEQPEGEPASVMEEGAGASQPPG
ncbi:MAG: nucleotide exchange factor GrpE [Chloroflexi bacterium]|nr:nucleotide exchange factor GrpE [Chloroflexota bacterium]